MKYIYRNSFFCKIKFKLFKDFDSSKVFGIVTQSFNESTMASIFFRIAGIFFFISILFYFLFLPNLYFIFAEYSDKGFWSLQSTNQFTYSIMRVIFSIFYIENVQKEAQFFPFLRDQDIPSFTMASILFYWFWLFVVLFLIFAVYHVFRGYKEIHGLPWFSGWLLNTKKFQVTHPDFLFHFTLYAVFAQFLGFIVFVFFFNSWLALRDSICDNIRLSTFPLYISLYVDDYLLQRDYLEKKVRVFEPWMINNFFFETRVIPFWSTVVKDATILKDPYAYEISKKFFYDLKYFSFLKSQKISTWFMDGPHNFGQALFLADLYQNKILLFCRESMVFNSYKKLYSMIEAFNISFFERKFLMRMSRTSTDIIISSFISTAQILAEMRIYKRFLLEPLDPAYFIPDDAWESACEFFYRTKLN